MAIQYTDRPDLPEALLKALKDESYSEGLEDHFNDLPPEIRARFKYQLSTTTLARSPRQRLLYNRHSSKIVLDPLSGFWRMNGRVVHFILEHYGDKKDLLEERFGIIVPVLVRGKRMEVYVHGASDRCALKDEKIQDYKYTKAEAMLYGEKEEHHAQLNVLSYIFRQHGYKIKALQNVFLFRNWEERNVKEGTLYPKECVQMADVPMWSDEKCLKYITDRVTVHMHAESLDDDDIDHCTDKERWMSDPQYRVYKVDMKKMEDGSLAPVQQTKSKFKTMSIIEAQDWTKDPNNLYPRLKVKGKNTEEPDTSKPNTYVIKEIKPKPVRCNFCEIAQFCGQRKAEIAAEIAAGEEEEDES